MYGFKYNLHRHLFCLCLMNAAQYVHYIFSAFQDAVCSFRDRIIAINQLGENGCINGLSCSVFMFLFSHTNISFGQVE